MLISSVNNSKVKELVRLKDKKYRDIVGLFFVEGKDLVDEAYKANLLEHLYVLDGYENIYEDVPFTYVSIDVMKKISDMNSVSGYYGVCRKLVDKEIGDRIILLDGVQDPGNLGTVIRSAVAFGFDTVVLSNETVDLYNPKVVRSTKGMLFNINIIVRDLEEFIDNELEGYTLYGTSVVNGNDIREEVIDKKIGLVIGNEGNGVSEGVMKRCNKYIYIKMSDKCESLNAGVAASILMYEVNNR